MIFNMYVEYVIKLAMVYVNMYMLCYNTSMIMILNYQALKSTHSYAYPFISSSSFFHQPEMPYEIIRDHSSPQLVHTND